jgi:AraC family ethanolamine operon transcriptional activator
MLMGAIRDAQLEPCQLSAGAATSVLQRVVLPRVGLDSALLGPSLWFRGAMPQAAYTMVYVLECPTPGRSFNFGLEHGDGHLGLFAPGGLVDAVTPSGYASVTLTVPADLFRAEMEARLPESPVERWSRGAGVRVGEGEDCRLRQLVSHALRQIEDPSGPLAGLAARVALEEELFEAFLDALASGLAAGLRRGGVRVARRFERLRRAREFLGDRTPQEARLGELCRELGMSRRGVEVLFEDCLGLSPAAFLRRQRLHAVRLGLREAEPASGVVKRMALESGFWHLGRFAAEYRALFGESPRETLGRSRARSLGCER